MSSTGSANAASPGEEENATITTDGPCLEETLESLRLGHDGKPYDDDILEGVRTQAERIVGSIVRAYGRGVAAGEVGAEGSGRASSEPPLGGACPTGLLYGRIQSGKTLAMIVTTAIAIDNGFRVVVVFTSDFVKLVEQTESRFSVLEGPMTAASTSRENWSHDAEHIRKHVGEHGIVIVCSKNAHTLEALGEFLDRIVAGDYPALILDDEADQATPDTKTRQRAQAEEKGASAEILPSAINHHIISAEESVCARLRHNVFIQVTATPYPLLLQHTESPLRPAFSELLEPGDGYTGGERFFSDAHMIDPPPAPLLFVESEESEQLEKASSHDPQLTDVPEGLQLAVAFFLFSAMAQQIESPRTKSKGQNFLCHTSHKKGEHEKLAALIRCFLDAVSDHLSDGKHPEVGLRLEQAHHELAKTVSEVPTMASIQKKLSRQLYRREIYVVNSEGSKAEFGRGLNFIVGGNILGRGLTIDNLLVTYYMRQAKLSQMDTMLQHARMFGYRASIMPFTRVFIPRILATRFHRIHTAEVALRRLLDETPEGDRIPVEVAGGLRPTRPSVVDPRYVSAFRSGQTVYPTYPMSAVRREMTEKITKRVEQITNHSLAEILQLKRPEDRMFHASIDEIRELVRMVPVHPEDVMAWDLRALTTVLDSIAERMQHRAKLYVRDMNRKEDRFLQGAASGAEDKLAKRQELPVLFLFYENATEPVWDGAHPFWFPSLTFPRSMPNQVFNLSD